MRGAEKTTKAEMRLDWRLSGRSWYADWGNLRVEIKIIGSRARGDVRYRVASVFGRNYFGEWLSDLDEAKELAEKVTGMEAVTIISELKRRGFLARRRRST